MGRLFSADGIRGVVGRRPLRREDAERLGRVVGKWLRDRFLAPAFLVGTDTRESCHRLKAAFVDGLARSGTRVVDAGILPTAAISYLIASKGLFAGGAVVSASHNPLVENGIKIFDQRGTKIDDRSEAIIEDLFFGDSLLPFEIRPASVTFEPGYATQYVRSLTREYSGREWHRYGVVLDCANGAAYRVGPNVMSSLGLLVTALNISPNGLNINLRAGSEFVRSDPRRLASSVREYGAEIGIALDGDADRVLLVDRDGRLYDGDMVLAMLALKFQQERTLKGNTVVITQMSNSGLTHYLQQRHIHTKQVHNGDKYITQVLLAENLTLGGEEVGHVILHTDDAHVTGDGLRTALAVLDNLMRIPDLKLQNMAPGMRKWPQVKASVWVGHRTEVPANRISGLPEALLDTQEAIPDLTRLECRPASTEPVYRIMLEARSTPVSVLAGHVLRLAKPIQRFFSTAGHPVDILNSVTGGRITPNLVSGSGQSLE